MSQHEGVTCELCKSAAAFVMNTYIDPNGKRVEWPKATTRADGIYFAIDCPQCGQREQCLARSPEAE